MNIKYDMRIVFPKSLQNNTDTYTKLIELYHKLNSEHKKNICLDFSKTTFISANLFALLGCCLDSTCNQHEHSIFLSRLHANIITVIQKNNFNKHFNLPALPDTHRNTIKYRIFNSTTNHLAEFEKYLLLNVFDLINKSIFSSMNSNFQDRIIDNFLEIFNNVIDHANSNHIYVCGQLFPKKAQLCFTIVDIGNTIPDNVSTYLSENKLAIPPSALEWAIQCGNSTKRNVPGGLGFSLLIDFLKANEGGFIIISGNEIYELHNHNEYFNNINVSFPGTIVTITINLNNNKSYSMYDTENNMIVF